MNTKTTMFLAFALLVLVAGWYAAQTTTSEPETAALMPVASTTTTLDLIEEELGDVVKVVVKRKGDDADWVFEKQAGDGSAIHSWRMTTPLDMACVRWEVDKFGNELGNLSYDISYQPGEPGAITAADAGLEPPQATVTLTDKDGTTATIEIGKPASNSETYVRLSGSEAICVASSNMQNLIKDRALEYRDKQLWTIDASNVTRVEIDDRSDAATEKSYAFIKDGAQWMIASPVTAPATNKVADMLSSLSRLRVTDWIDDRSERMAGYGLKSASWTLRVTTEQEITSDEDNEESKDGSAPDDNAPPQPQIKTTVYTLHLSDQSPIGEATKVYMHVGDESVVGTLMKTVTDKFKPVMSEWRDMHVTSVDVGDTTRIELAGTDGSATLVQADGLWTFEPDGGRAEESAVADLLKAIGDLSAVAFVDTSPGQASSFGFAEPRVDLRLTVPGVVDSERIVVGAYTDQASKRLVYVGRGDLRTVAKVRAADVAALTEPPQVYRDRAIVDVLPSRFQRITIERENSVLGDRMTFTLGRQGNSWSLVEPITADVNQAQMDKLIETLGGLRAMKVVAEKGQASAYGLHAPAATLTLVFHTAKMSDADDSGQDSQSVQLLATTHDGKHYVKRSDRGTIYEVAASFYEELLAEYHDDRVLSFDEEKVSRFDIRNNDITHAFAKRDGKWIYEAEPDLPLDAAKVDNLLLQVRDLRTNRYASYQAGDLSRFALGDALPAVTVTLDDGAVLDLYVSLLDASHGPDRGVYARVGSRDGVFLLAKDSTQRIQVSLDNLEAVP